MSLVFLAVSTLIFLLGCAFAVLALRGDAARLKRMNLALIGTGFLFQSGFLYLRGQLHQRCPITDGAEVLVFISWSLALMYLVLGRAFRLSLVGMFTAPILSLLQLVALVVTLWRPVTPRPSERLDPWLEMHASMSLLAYGAFAFSAISGIMYLVQNRELKSGKPGRLAFQLAPIRYLADALVRLLGIGLLLLTAGIGSAFFMETRPSATHLALSGAVWVLYTGILVVYLVRHPSAKSLSVASLGAFALALLTLTAI